MVSYLPAAASHFYVLWDIYILTPRRDKGQGSPRSLRRWPARQGCEFTYPHFLLVLPNLSSFSLCLPSPMRHCPSGVSRPPPCPEKPSRPAGSVFRGAGGTTRARRGSVVMVGGEPEKRRSNYPAHGHPSPPSLSSLSVTRHVSHRRHR